MINSTKCATRKIKQNRDYISLESRRNLVSSLGDALPPYPDSRLLPIYLTLQDGSEDKNDKKYIHFEEFEYFATGSLSPSSSRSSGTGTNPRYTNS